MDVTMRSRGIPIAMARLWFSSWKFSASHQMTHPGSPSKADPSGHGHPVVNVLQSRSAIQVLPSPFSATSREENPLPIQFFHDQFIGLVSRSAHEWSLPL